MPVSPVVLVKDGLGPFVPTFGGVNVGAGDTISVQLGDITGVTAWFLQVLGTDELSFNPALTSVNPVTNLVATPGTTVTFPFPNGLGRSVLLQSTVTGTGGPVSTTFALYSLTSGGKRVGSAGEQREGNTNYGWITIVNPIIRQGAAVLFYNDTLVGPLTGSNTIQGAIDYLKANSGFVAGGDLSGTSLTQIVVGLQTVPVSTTPPTPGQVLGFSGGVWVPITIISGITVQSGGVGIPGNPHSTLNYKGVLSATDAGGGVADIVVSPGINGQALFTLAGVPTWATIPLPTDLNITGEAQGDILYFNGTNWVRLPAGVTGQFLKTQGVASNPIWANQSTIATDLNITAQAQGDILYFNGTNWVRLPAGVSGQTLKTQGVAANPIWATTTVLGSNVIGPVALATNQTSYEIPFTAGIFSEGLGVFTRVGCRTVDMSAFPATIGALNRHVKFVVSIDRSGASTSVEAQLFDVTHVVAVTGTDLTSTSTTSDEKTSADLTVGSGAGNIRNDVLTTYEVQLKMNGGTPNIDQVFLTNARLVITYV